MEKISRYQEQKTLQTAQYEYSKEHPDNVLLKAGDVISLDQIEGQHYPKKVGAITRSPLYVEWRGRIVYFTGRRGEQAITVLSSDDVGYPRKIPEKLRLSQFKELL